MHLGREFETLIYDSLQQTGVYKSLVHEGSRAGNTTKVDILAEQDNGKFIVFEVKYYKDKFPNASAIFNAASQLDYLLDRLNADENIYEKGILWVSCVINPDFRAKFASSYEHIEIFDVNDLAALVRGFENLNRRLLELINFEISSISSSDSHGSQTLRPKHPASSESISRKNCICKQLIAELKAIPPGNKTFNDYENKCTEILKLLFDKYLGNWEVQQKLENDNQLDLICRIKDSVTNSSWKFIAEEVLSRYVVFEFKNYTDPITQKELYTTERYLYDKAFRKVAFIISPQECDKKLIQICHGITRESGKLILFLTNSDLEEMCKIFCDSGEPSDMIGEIIDKYFMSLSR